MLLAVSSVAALLAGVSAGTAARRDRRPAARAAHRAHRSVEVPTLAVRPRRGRPAGLHGPVRCHSLDTNLYFLHRGVIEPKSGIGAHFHNQCEEMFVIFDGEAQFTIDGRTSLLKGPAGAPRRMGHSHAIYNPTDKPVQWMNINVSAMQGRVRRVRSGRRPRRRGARSDSGLHDHAAGSVAAASGCGRSTGGKGTAQYRRALTPSVFLARGLMSTTCCSRRVRRRRLRPIRRSASSTT